MKTRKSLCSKLLIVILFILLCLSITVYGGDAMNIQKKHEQMLYPVVSVIAKGKGSGVVIYSGEGYSLILTAKHNLNLMSETEVRFFPSKEKYPATIFKIGKGIDLAILKVDHEHPYVALMFYDAVPKVFTDVYKVGGGLGLEPFPTEGIISSVKDGLLSVTSPIIFGDSGGAIYIDHLGSYLLVGIVISVAHVQKAPITHIGFGYNMKTVAKFLDDK